MHLSTTVLRLLCAEQISDEQIAIMLDSASLTRVRGANRRYFHWLFRVEGDEVLWMQYFDLVEVDQQDKDKIRMLEDHDTCEGAGCHDCGWVGQIGRWVSDKAVAPGAHPLPQRAEGVFKQGQSKHLDRRRTR